MLIAKIGLGNQGDGKLMEKGLAAAKGFRTVVIDFFNTALLSAHKQTPSTSRGLVHAGIFLMFP